MFSNSNKVDYRYFIPPQSKGASKNKLELMRRFLLEEKERSEKMFKQLMYMRSEVERMKMLLMVLREKR